MDAETLAGVMGWSCKLARYEELCPAFNEAMIAAGVNTVLRARMWCAQLGHESAGLFYMEEIADGSAYNGRTDLGNTQPGDGPRFKGRGPIQLTGRSNYTRCSAWAFEHGLVPTRTYFVDHPTEAASDLYGFVGAVWYWTVARPDLNTASDQGDLTWATRMINGGTNGIDDRRYRYNASAQFGSALLPSPSNLLGFSDSEMAEFAAAMRQLGAS